LDASKRTGSAREYLAKAFPHLFGEKVEAARERAKVISSQRAEIAKELQRRRTNQEELQDYESVDRPLKPHEMRIVECLQMRIASVDARGPTSEQLQEDSHALEDERHRLGDVA